MNLEKFDKERMRLENEVIIAINDNSSSYEFCVGKIFNLKKHMSTAGTIPDVVRISSGLLAELYQKQLESGDIGEDGIILGMKIHPLNINQDWFILGYTVKE